MTVRGKRNEPRGMIRLEEQVDAEINVLRLPPGEDPDEVIRNKISIWSYAVAHPLPLVDYYFEVKTAGLNLREPYGQAEAGETPASPDRHHHGSHEARCIHASISQQ